MLFDWRMYSMHSSYVRNPRPHLVLIGPGGAFSIISVRRWLSPEAISARASSSATAVPASPFWSNAM